MIVARIVSGIGMGFINSTVPVIQAEFSPKATRGRYVCAQLSTLNFGEPRQGAFINSLSRY
jgi:MFS family permease